MDFAYASLACSAHVDPPHHRQVVVAQYVVIQANCIQASAIYAVRRKTLKRFFNDNYLVVVGLFCYLLTAALQQTRLGHMYELFAVEAGKLMPSLPFMKG